MDENKERESAKQECGFRPNLVLPDLHGGRREIRRIKGSAALSIFEPRGSAFKTPYQALIGCDLPS